MDLDLPDVVAEVRAAFDAYERALTGNDVAALDAMFHGDARTIRFGAGENLFGYAQIKAFRAARRLKASPVRSRTRSSLPTAATPPSPQRCSIAPPCPGRSAGRCRPGCASRKAGAWWRRM